MKKMYYIIVIALLFFPNVNFGQVINLGTASDFILFTTVGAVSSTGVTFITGNVGTTAGAVGGFSNINGVIQNGNATSILCAASVLSLYNQLNIATPTLFPAAVLGNSQVLGKGVYFIPSAASLNLCLVLDAQGDSNAVFIFQIQGAFSTGPSSRICLINGALAANVFWKVEGAVSMGAGTFFRGNIVANNGAIAMAAGDTLEGRALSTTGAISLNGTVAFVSKGIGSPILTGPSAPILGSTAGYALFSSNGAVTNAGITNVVGDIGTNAGFTSGYNSLNDNGTIHITPDASTVVCAADLLNVYAYLNALPYDIELLYPAQLGNNLVLTPHTYIMNAAAVLTDTLSLNAGGDSNAVFVFHVNGAFTTSVYSKVKLIGGTQSKNVFWLINGAATINNNSIFRGTIVSNAAIVLNTATIVDGGVFTIVGTITTTANNVSILKVPSLIITPAYSFPCAYTPLPIELLSFSGECNNENILLKWSTASEINNDYFSIERRSTDGIHWQTINTVKGAGNSFTLQNYTYAYSEPDLEMPYYRLKQSDVKGNFKYSAIIAVENCIENPTELTVYPNPAIAGQSVNINLRVSNKQEVLVAVTDVLGQEYFSRIIIVEKGSTIIAIDPYKNISAGIYIIKGSMDNNIYSKKMIIK